MVNIAVACLVGLVACLPLPTGADPPVKFTKGKFAPPGLSKIEGYSEHSEVIQLPGGGSQTVYSYSYPGEVKTKEMKWDTVQGPSSSHSWSYSSHDSESGGAGGFTGQVGSGGSKTVTTTTTSTTKGGQAVAGEAKGGAKKVKTSKVTTTSSNVKKGGTREVTVTTTGAKKVKGSGTESVVKVQKVRAPKVKISSTSGKNTDFSKDVKNGKLTAKWQSKVEDDDDDEGYQQVVVNQGHGWPGPVGQMGHGYHMVYTGGAPMPMPVQYPYGYQMGVQMPIPQYHVYPGYQHNHQIVTHTNAQRTKGSKDRKTRTITLELDGIQNIEEYLRRRLNLRTDANVIFQKNGEITIEENGGVVWAGKTGGNSLSVVETEFGKHVHDENCGHKIETSETETNIQEVNSQGPSTVVSNIGSGSTSKITKTVTEHRTTSSQQQVPVTVGQVTGGSKITTITETKLNGEEQPQPQQVAQVTGGSTITKVTKTEITGQEQPQPQQVSQVTGGSTITKVTKTEIIGQKEPEQTSSITKKIVTHSSTAQDHTAPTTSQTTTYHTGNVDNDSTFTKTTTTKTETTQGNVEQTSNTGNTGSQVTVHKVISGENRPISETKITKVTETTETVSDNGPSVITYHHPKPAVSSTEQTVTKLDKTFDVQPAQQTTGGVTEIVKTQKVVENVKEEPKSSGWVSVTQKGTVSEPVKPAVEVTKTVVTESQQVGGNTGSTGTTTTTTTSNNQWGGISLDDVREAVKPGRDWYLKFEGNGPSFFNRLGSLRHNTIDRVMSRVGGIDNLERVGYSSLSTIRAMNRLERIRMLRIISKMRAIDGLVELGFEDIASIPEIKSLLGDLTIEDLFALFSYYNIDPMEELYRLRTYGMRAYGGFDPFNIVRSVGRTHMLDRTVSSTGRFGNTGSDRGWSVKFEGGGRRGGSSTWTRESNEQSTGNMKIQPSGSQTVRTVEQTQSSQQSQTGSSGSGYTGGSGSKMVTVVEKTQSTQGSTGGHGGYTVEYGGGAGGSRGGSNSKTVTQYETIHSSQGGTGGKGGMSIEYGGGAGGSRGGSSSETVTQYETIHSSQGGTGGKGGMTIEYGGGAGGSRGGSSSKTVTQYETIHSSQGSSGGKGGARGKSKVVTETQQIQGDGGVKVTGSRGKGRSKTQTTTTVIKESSSKSRGSSKIKTSGGGSGAKYSKTVTSSSGGGGAGGFDQGFVSSGGQGGFSYSWESGGDGLKQVKTKKISGRIRADSPSLTVA